MTAVWEILDKPDVPGAFLPCIQLAGQSVECALKAYLSAATGGVSHVHDLLQLRDEAIAQGAVLTDRVFLDVLNRDYFMKTDGAWKYPSRYPKSGRVPGDWQFFLQRPGEYGELVNSLCDQAIARLEQLSAPD
jgi:hypothetical protein